MKIDFNKIALILILISVATVITHFVNKKKQQCFTCVCKSKDNKKHITEADCNFDSTLTKKKLDELPADVKAECKKKCANLDKKYDGHFVWSE